MRETPDRGRLSDALATHIRASTELTGHGIVFGDGEAPPEAGWSGVEPGEGEFTASVVLTVLPAQPAPAPDTLRQAHTSWRCMYQLRSTGGTRSQADFASDHARHAAESFPTTEYNLGTDWKVQQVLFTRISGVRPQRVSDVPQWICDDVVELWLTRSAR